MRRAKLLAAGVVTGLIGHASSLQEPGVYGVVGGFVLMLCVGVFLVAVIIWSEGK